MICTGANYRDTRLGRRNSDGPYVHELELDTWFALAVAAECPLFTTARRGYLHIFACTCVRLYVCMCVCEYVCLYIYIL